MQSGRVLLCIRLFDLFQRIASHFFDSTQHTSFYVYYSLIRQNKLVPKTIKNASSNTCGFQEKYFIFVKFKIFYSHL